MGEIVPAHTSPTLHPPPLPLCINCRDYSTLRVNNARSKSLGIMCNITHPWRLNPHQQTEGAQSC